MATSLRASAQKVQQALEALGMACEVVEFPETTRSAKEAARAIGCRVEQIAKSLVFRTRQTQIPILVVAGGANRVNVKKLAELVAEPVEMADADFIREKTGFVIGGVPPIGHRQPLQTFIDEDLFKCTEIWAAAGTPYAVFKLSPHELKNMTAGRVVSISE